MSPTVACPACTNCPICEGLRLLCECEWCEALTPAKQKNKRFCNADCRAAANYNSRQKRRRKGRDT